jgi:hypothetical protein
MDRSMLRAAADRARRSVRKSGELTGAEAAVLAVLQQRLAKVPRTRAS